MATALSVENLSTNAARSSNRFDWLQFLLTLEAWLDDRASRRALYSLDGAALADLGLSPADVDRIAHRPHA
ncbi:MAG TPA: DUF1127 domain-containing protein [Microvirga sp.]|nr:DUF1127 domain-containing protein [Microvirga sp.]